MKHSKEERLAEELADTLGDQESLPFYRDKVKQYSEGFLRGKLKKVMSIPQKQIRKTRGALFTYLIGQHEHRHDQTRYDDNSCKDEDEDEEDEEDDDEYDAYW